MRRAKGPAARRRGGEGTARRKREFERVLIVGLGLIGGSLALALRRSGHQGWIVGVSGPQNLEEAKRLGAIDDGAGYGALARLAPEADLIVLATPIERIISLLGELGRAPLSPGCIVTDVGSTKRSILAAAARSLPRGARFIGGHPMAGSEKRGMGAADPFLFQNAYYVLTTGEAGPPGDLDRLGDFLSRRTGARVVHLSADEHDRVAAAISHLPQLLAVTLVNSLELLGPLRETGARLAAGGFRDMTRIASSPFSLWRDILATNRGPVLETLRRFQKSLEELRELLSDGDGSREDGKVARAFERAAATRAGIPRDTKGFLRPLAEILVVVEDRPGIISRITSPLAESGINIKDIEVLKVREDEGGSLRLGFATPAMAEEAVGVLRGEGFTARIRD